MWYGGNLGVDAIQDKQLFPGVLERALGVQCTYVQKDYRVCCLDKG